MRLAYIRELMNKDSRDCDRLFEEGKKLLVRGKEEPDVWMENYQTAAQYLIERGRYQEAVTILDEGIDLCLERNGDNIYDMQYLGMFTLKIQLMYSGLNEMVEAKQLMVEQMEKMFRNKETVGSLTLLNYLHGTEKRVPDASFAGISDAICTEWTGSFVHDELCHSIVD